MDAYYSHELQHRRNFKKKHVSYLLLWCLDDAAVEFDLKQ